MKYLIFLGVGWGRVSSGFVGGLVLGVFGLSGVFDLGDVSAVVIDGVGNGLGTSVGEENVVRSGDDFAVAGLLVAVVVVGVVILHTVGEVVWHSGLYIHHSIENVFID